MTCTRTVTGHVASLCSRYLRRLDTRCLDCLKYHNDLYRQRALQMTTEKATQICISWTVSYVLMALTGESTLYQIFWIRLTWTACLRLSWWPHQHSMVLLVETGRTQSCLRLPLQLAQIWYVLCNAFWCCGSQRPLWCRYLTLLHVCYSCGSQELELLDFRWHHCMNILHQREKAGCTPWLFVEGPRHVYSCSLILRSQNHAYDLVRPMLWVLSSHCHYPSLRLMY